MRKTLASAIAAVLALTMATSCSQSSKNGNGQDTTDTATQNIEEQIDAAQTVAEEAEILNPDQVKIGVIELDNDNILRPGIKTNHLIIVDFNTTWCGPCRQFRPAFDAAAEKFAGKVEFNLWMSTTTSAQQPHSEWKASRMSHSSSRGKNPRHMSAHRTSCPRNRSSS